MNNLQLRVVLLCYFILGLQQRNKAAHVRSQNNQIFSRIIYVKIEFSSQRRKMVLFLTANMAAVKSRSNQQWADLATGRERHLTTGKRAERTKQDFQCPICRSAIGQASCLICARRRQLTFPFCC